MVGWSRHSVDLQRTRVRICSTPDFHARSHRDFHVLSGKWFTIFFSYSLLVVLARDRNAPWTTFRFLNKQVLNNNKNISYTKEKYRQHKIVNKPGSQPQKKVAFQALEFFSEMYTKPELKHNLKLTFQYRFMTIYFKQNVNIFNFELYFNWSMKLLVLFSFENYLSPTNYI